MGDGPADLARSTTEGVGGLCRDCFRIIVDKRFDPPGGFFLTFVQESSQLSGNQSENNLKAICQGLFEIAQKQYFDNVQPFPRVSQPPGSFRM